MKSIIGCAACAVCANLFQKKMDYRYKLETYKGQGTRYRCPRCHRQERTFVRYIDTATNQHVHENVGKCNREDNCEYHYTPKMFFEDNHIQHDKHLPPIRKPKPLTKAISYIAEDVFFSSLKHYESNNFVQWLRKLFGADIANNLVEKYGIGTSKHWTGATVFWLIDIDLKIRTGEIIHFDAETGRTIKEPQRRKYWVHSALKQPDFNLQQCFFGEHLLTISENSSKPIAIVEAAKTAIIASVYFPEYIWLACLGKNGLNPDKFNVLKGRTVVLYPDVNAFDYWDEKAREFSHIASVEVSSVLEKIVTPDERKSGLDIADYLLRNASNESAEQPAIKKFQLSN